MTTIRTAILFLAVLAPAAYGGGADELNPASKTPEVRMDSAGRILLSRDGRPLVALQLRQPANGALAALAPEAVKEMLSAPLLLSGDERVRELELTPAAGNAQDRLHLLLRARKAAAGVRLLVSSTFSGPSREDLAPGGKLPAPPPLELAIQIFPDANGKLPVATYVDGNREPMPLAPLGPVKSDDPAPPITKEGKRKARAWTFEIPKPAIMLAPASKKEAAPKKEEAPHRVHIARSGPAEWDLRRAPGCFLLTARLLPDPREGAEFGSFVVYLGGGADGEAPEVSPVKLDKRETPARDFIEGALRVYASGANPFVLAETAVVAEVAFPPKPNGEVTVKHLPCFFWEAPSQSPAEGEFRFRFAPPEEGVYGVRITAVTAAGQARGEALAFRAGPPASPGFVKVRPGERQFRMDDGNVFIPLGTGPLDEIRANRETHARQFPARVREGGNCAQVTLWNRSSLALEGPKAGEFNPDIASTLDAILRSAQARGIHLNFVVETWLELESGSSKHPYFREMGGPLAATPEFFRDAAARKHFQNRLTYLAARFGAYRSVLSWELLYAADEAWPALKNDPGDAGLKPNEIDLTRRARRDVQEWAAIMALHLKGMDQHEHPVCMTTRVSPNRPWVDLERIEQLDFTITEHFTSGNAYLQDARYRDEVGLLSAWAAAARQPGRAHRPYVVGLFNPMLWKTEAADASLHESAAEIMSHNARFASLAAGMAAPCQPMGGYSLDGLGPLAKFSAALAQAAEAEGKEELRFLSENIEAPDKTPLRLLGRAGRRGMAVWLQDPRSNWAAAYEKRVEPGEIKGVELRLPGLAEGTYKLTWLDTREGTAFSNETHKAPPKHLDRPVDPLIVRVPTFRRDIALLVTREE